MSVAHNGSYGRFELYQPRHPKPDSELLVGLMHGWLGSGTMRYVATKIAEQGHTIFTVNHTKWRQGDRAKAIHEATKSAVGETGLRDVLYIGHSLAARDLVEAAAHQNENTELTYEFTKLVTVDGLGTNGKPVNLFGFRREAEEHLQLLKDSPKVYAEVLGKSVVNLLRNPFTHAVEGVGNLFYDGTGPIATLENSGIVVERHFHEGDGVITTPGDGRGPIHDGGHLTFAVIPDNALEIVRAA